MSAPFVRTYSRATSPINGGRFAGKLAGALTLGDVSLTTSLTGDLVLPSWLASAAVQQWVAVPNSTLKGSGAEETALPAGYGNRDTHINAENGSAFDRRTSEIWHFGGGHADWAGNGIHSFNMSAESPGWVLRRDRSAQADIPPSSITTDVGRYYDGRPCSRHTYQGTHFIEKLGKYMAISGFSWANANGDTMEPVTFDAATGDWDAAGTWNKTFSPAPSYAQGIFAKHPTTEDIYFAVGGGYQLYKLDTTTKQWSSINNSIPGYFPYFECGAIAPARGLFIMTTRGDSGSTSYYARLYSLTTGSRTDITINPGAALTAFQALSTNHAGVHYNADQDCFYYYFGGTSMGGRIFKITPNGTTTWDMVELTMTGLTVPDGVGVANGNILTRFGYSSQLRAVYALPSAASPIYMARVA